MEYGFSCMGYEVVGVMGVKLVVFECDVICFVGDGSYMMVNLEMVIVVMCKVLFIVVLIDNCGYGCINCL